MEGEGRRKNYDRIIDHLTDFSLGFFIYPFLYFVTYTTIDLVVSPKSIAESTAIIYVTLLAGFIYILRKTIILTDYNLKSVPVSVFGLLIFLLLLFL